METKSIETNLSAIATIKPEQQNPRAEKQNQSINEQENDNDRDDRVNISTAAQRLSSAPRVNNSHSAIQSRQQAEQITQAIQKTFQINPGQATSTQANIAAASIRNILG